MRIGALVQARKVEAIGMMAGVVAHDFNNILAVISAYANFLHEGLPADCPERSHVDEIARAAARGGCADRAAHLVRPQRRRAVACG